ncbi:hypothetical protein F5Y19DRAFT_377215 [Xylariaceae sp. FL1651]|nr:hypothetical protein F5Y19DRAFT_377215 [Xylariaceae sp. FL1651]
MMSIDDDDDGDDDDDDDGGNDGGDDHHFTQLRQLTAASASVPASAPDPHRKSFNDLPPEIRLHIWRRALSTSPTQTPPSRSWALAVLPRQPWLELGLSPPDVKLENPPWSQYVDNRHVPAMILSRVNREARRVVLERHTPILVSQTIRESSRGIPRFIWIDRYSDVIHFFGERFRPELFEQAGRTAYPELYR